MPKVPVIDIRPHDLETVRGILRRHVPGYEVWAFGSRVRWSAREYSDLDLAIRSDEEIPWEVISAIKNELSESNLPMMVDVLDMAGVSEKFRGIIEEEYAVVQKKGVGSLIPFDKAVEINPKVRLNRGEVYPYVDMKQVNPESRSVRSGESREFKGSGSRFQSGDTLMARITPCLENGKIARFVSDNQPGHGSTEFIVIRGKEGVTDNDFAYYLTRWEKVKSFAISQMAGTSGRQRVPTNSLSQLEIRLPPLAEQKKIAHILGTLDDKIELNRQMNQTLEAMARAIFKSWFVDFAPVHAKAKGRDTGLPPEVADLFPDGFEDSELGEIPRGWGVATLNDVAEIIKGRSYKSVELEPSDTALVTLKSFQRGGGYRPDGLKPYTGEYKPEQVVKSGELIVSYTDVTQAGEIIGMPAVVLPTDEFSTLVASLDVGIVRSKVEYLSIPYLYHAFLTKSFRSHIYAYSTGTTVLHLSVKGLPEYKLVVPPKELCLRYNSLCEPLLHDESVNHEESCALGEMRERLIPVLLSGQISLAKGDSAGKTQ